MAIINRNERDFLMLMLIVAFAFTLAHCQGYIAPPNTRGNPQTATVQTLQTGGGFTSATGDRPASDFPYINPQKSLGSVARENRKAHKKVKQSSVVYVN